MLSLLTTLGKKFRAVRRRWRLVSFLLHRKMTMFQEQVAFEETAVVLGILYWTSRQRAQPKTITKSWRCFFFVRKPLGKVLHKKCRKGCTLVPLHKRTIVFFCFLTCNTGLLLSHRVFKSNLVFTTDFQNCLSVCIGSNVLNGRSLIRCGIVRIRRRFIQVVGGLLH